jgi:hypothetical protein
MIKIQYIVLVYTIIAQYLVFKKPLFLGLFYQMWITVLISPSLFSTDVETRELLFFIFPLLHVSGEGEQKGVRTTSFSS